MAEREKFETESTSSLRSFCCKGKERDGVIAGDELNTGSPPKDGRNDGKDPGVKALWPKITALPRSYVNFKH